MIWLIVFAAVMPCLAFARANSGFFNLYKNNYFVETGSWRGDGIANAIEANYNEIHSIEITSHYYEECKERFKSDPRVHLWLGDSSELLKIVISTINEPITFWLDGHFSGVAERTGKGKTNTPILAELEAIKNHPVKTHTILIDDVRLFGSEEFDLIPLQMIIQKIYEINPLYQITFEEGYVPGDILVARIIR